MAIVNCPQCNKQISDKAAACNECGFVLQGLDPKSLERKRAYRKADQITKLTTHGMWSILLFVAGIAGVVYFRDETSPDPTWQSQVALVMTVIGFIWYIINRMRLVAARRR